MGRRRVQQQVVDPQPGVPPPRPARVVPERVDPLARVQVPERVGPTLGEEPAVRLARLRPGQGVVCAYQYGAIGPDVGYAVGRHLRNARLGLPDTLFGQHNPFCLVVVKRDRGAVVEAQQDNVKAHAVSIARTHGPRRRG